MRAGDPCSLAQGQGPVQGPEGLMPMGCNPESSVNIPVPVSERWLRIGKMPRRQKSIVTAFHKGCSFQGGVMILSSKISELVSLPEYPDVNRE